ncbi:MAG: cytochrome-c oxidase, cbb3-type subunit III [Paracoccaceae bacterium]|nr:cytochrome-c oxidase, cbb3-type subunit III [Paracoccaceae bacterium]
MAVPERDELTGTETTQHEWDGITELDTPLPRWWLWTFYITIIWGIGYTIAYPAWPLVTSATEGVLGYSSRMQLAETIEAHEASRQEITQRVGKADFSEIEADTELDDFAQAGGAAIFRTYCSQCHGAGGAGAPGYPNLRDDDWLWGGAHEDIYLTIRNGIRWAENEETRDSAMPAFGADEILDDAQIAAVADHALSLSGAGEASAEGAEIYAENCAACHGDNGEGVRELGGPKLSDGIWLYGGEREDVIRTITYSRAGAMPSWDTRLTEAEIKQVTHYVHSRAAGE